MFLIRNDRHWGDLPTLHQRQLVERNSFGSRARCCEALSEAKPIEQGPCVVVRERVGISSVAFVQIVVSSAAKLAVGAETLRGTKG